MTKVVLTPNEIKPLCSDYLQHGRASEAWEIKSIEIEDEDLSALIQMTRYYLSKTDRKGFHLTVFSTLEFLSQLMIIYMHHWAGIEEKVLEGWMSECSTKMVRAIRNPDRITVKMKVRKIKKVKHHLYCIADYKVVDDHDGLFEISLKGFLS